MVFKNKTEDVIKRKSYYGFSKNYPGKLGSSRYVIGESRVVRKREILRKILLALIVIMIFISAFLITDICLNISEKPVQASKTEVTETIVT